MTSPMGTSNTIKERELDKIDSRLSYSRACWVVKLILDDPAFVDEQGTFSFKFIRVARFLKEDAPHVFQIHENTETKNTMDRWRWDLLN
jgi:hypothetical protein